MSVEHSVDELPPAVGSGLTIGLLVGLTNDDRTPLVTYRGQRGSAAVRARSIVDLSGVHIGCEVVLMTEIRGSDVPIVMGVLREDSWPLPNQPAQVEVDADGQRMVVKAKRELVFQCGKASITLTKAGKVLIEGTYISHRSSGSLRVKGASVEVN